MELGEFRAKFLFNSPWPWPHCGLANVGWLNDHIQAAASLNILQSPGCRPGFLLLAPRPNARVRRISIHRTTKPISIWLCKHR